MADQHEHPEQRRQSGNGRGLSRALAGPARMVSKVLPRGTTPPPAPSGGPRRSAVVDCGLYVDGVRQPGRPNPVDALAEAQARDDAFVWIGLREPDAEEFAELAREFKLHELAVEDAVKASQRPKMERYDGTTFIVVRTARYVEHDELTANSEVIETGDVMLFLGEHFVITVRHGDACRLAPVRADLEAKRDLLAQGPWAVFHAVVDRIVDVYLDATAQLEVDLGEVEEAVFGSGNADIQRIYHLKRELVEFKRAVVPLQRPLFGLVQDVVPVVPPVPSEIRRYIRDIADHLSRTVEQITSYDDLLNSILQARLAQVSIDQNNDMRKIAAWAAIAAVPTAIAGIYGMNFKHMPELNWSFGYPLVILLILGLCTGLYVLLRRSGWL